MLDAGGGSGMLKIAEEKIKDQNLKGKIKIVKYNVTNMNEFKDNTFDLAIAEGDPVSYCSNPDQAISELARVY